MSFEIVKKDDFPEYLYARLKNWGRWSLYSGQDGRAGGLEGKFRSNRCEECYEDEVPCERCRYLPEQAGTVDVADAELVEAAWVKLSGRLSQEKLQLRDYFCFQVSQSRLVKKSGRDGRFFWYDLLRAAKEIEQHAAMIACKENANRLSSVSHGREPAVWREKLVA
ncbi:hypothetical protein [Aquitalea aquatilis]|uniref:hypothetical protein n=1 Tax=Aquitalea aquatilis TaxID=1537400 RepID=UPI0010BDCE8F|nr:hypothetical protein [Aquitalea aquatilis]